LPVSGPPKSSKTQAHAGTRSFNKRLTLSDVLGIQTTDDTDGEDDGAHETLSDEQMSEIRALMKQAGTPIASILKFAKAPTLDAVTVDKYDDIISTLRAKVARAEAGA